MDNDILIAQAEAAQAEAAREVAAYLAQILEESAEPPAGLVAERMIKVPVRSWRTLCQIRGLSGEAISTAEVALARDGYIVRAR